MAHVIKFSISSTYLFQFCKRQLFMGFDSSLFNLGVRSPKTIYLKAQESLHQKKDQKKSEFLTGTFQLHFFSPIGKHDMFIIKRYVLRNLFEKFRNHCFSSNTYNVLAKRSPKSYFATHMNDLFVACSMSLIWP